MEITFKVKTRNRYQSILRYLVIFASLSSQFGCISSSEYSFSENENGSVGAWESVINANFCMASAPLRVHAFELEGAQSVSIQLETAGSSGATDTNFSVSLYKNIRDNVWSRLAVMNGKSMLRDVSTAGQYAVVISHWNRSIKPTLDADLERAHIFPPSNRFDILSLPLGLTLTNASANCGASYRLHVQLQDNLPIRVMNPLARSWPLYDIDPSKDGRLKPRLVHVDQPYLLKITNGSGCLMLSRASQQQVSSSFEHTNTSISVVKRQPDNQVNIESILLPEDSILQLSYFPSRMDFLAIPLFNLERSMRDQEILNQNMNVVVRSFLHDGARRTISVCHVGRPPNLTTDGRMGVYGPFNNFQNPLRLDFLPNPASSCIEVEVTEQYPHGKYIVVLDTNQLLNATESKNALLAHTLIE